MSNKFAPYVWEAVPQVMLNTYAEEDGLPKRARHKWVHIWQAVKLLDMSPQEIFKEGYRDFLALRTNAFHYLDVMHHVDGILHPDPVIEHMGKAAFQRLGNDLFKQLKESGLPNELDLALFSLVFDDPEVLHRKVRKSVRDVRKRRRIEDGQTLPKSSYNGRQLREMGIWQDMSEVEIEDMKKPVTEDGLNGERNS